MKDITVHINSSIIIVKTLFIEKSLPTDKMYSLICDNVE